MLSTLTAETKQYKGALKSCSILYRVTQASTERQVQWMDRLLHMTLLQIWRDAASAQMEQNRLARQAREAEEALDKLATDMAQQMEDEKAAAAEALEKTRQEGEQALAMSEKEVNDTKMRRALETIIFGPSSAPRRVNGKRSSSDPWCRYGGLVAHGMLRMRCSGRQ